MEWLEQFCRRMEKSSEQAVEQARQNKELDVAMFNHGVLFAIKMLREEMEIEK
jgi:hypothetical protein